MSGTGSRNDLVVLVADQDMEFAVSGILDRSQSLGVHPLAYDVFRHPERDPGCRAKGHVFLRPFAGQYRRALVLFDHEGSGHEALTRDEVEGEVEERLSRNGWSGRGAAVAIAPELETWVWSDSPHVPDILGWRDAGVGPREWLCAETEYWDAGDAKPARPKEAMRAVLRHVRRQFSASLFRELASRVSLSRCVDPAFAKLTGTLSAWFGVDQAAGQRD